MTFNTIGYNVFRLNNSFNKAESESDEEDIPSILNTELTTLTPGQCITFTVIVGTLGILSVFGNLGTLYANQKRKIRLFFRTCLISLALSDLITTVFMTVGYLAQFGVPYVQVWCLGGLMCGVIPFVTTGAILVSSMILVGIALDRYFAVMKAVLGFWNPNKVFCICYAICIWGLSFGIASPMYSAYSIYHVYILTSGIDRNDSADLVEIDLVEMCVSAKESNAYYYVVVLGLIFIPTLIAFVWLNSIIANKLWIRRHSVNVQPPSGSPATPTTTTLSTAAAVAGFRKPKEKQMEMVEQQFNHRCHCHGKNKICASSNLTVPTSPAATTTTTTTTTTTPTKSLKNNLKTKAGSGVRGVGKGGNSAKHISSREARHLRMFTIVVILMAVFIFFRLPAWIFLIFRMYGNYTQRVHWILHFSFGILTLTSCVLNPLLYTFLAETIQYAMFMKGKLCGLRRYFENCGMDGCCCCLWCSSYIDDKDNKKMSQNQNQNENQNDDDGYNDSTSNDGAKSTSRNSDDDSEVYTIIPVLREVM